MLGLDIFYFINTIGAANTRFFESSRPVLKLFFVITKVSDLSPHKEQGNRPQLSASKFLKDHFHPIESPIAAKDMLCFDVVLLRLGECLSELYEVNAECWSEMCSHTIDGPVLPEIDSHPYSGQSQFCCIVIGRRCWVW
ncbi:hypothetical protein F0562_025718 [Nyssa sinensis]|uniref:Uncharacterized protein n=1 Tax=Nyssa sinensis TaxID=561372 RepID=A0A5J5B9H0_9ASTE|nr:hypothetical protein F0562_025718 [Nyssa sinensis]